jgi:hypothetical protein
VEAEGQRGPTKKEPKNWTVFEAEETQESDVGAFDGEEKNCVRVFA